mgnify:CR=1 FL=1
MKTQIHFLNHSSLLVNYNDQFLLTDPFFFKPAFETWLPVPPAYINPAYLLAISKTVKHFGILISHGHDDHCDDDLLKLFTHCPVFITKFNSPGVQNRLLKIGFKEIYEVNAEETKIGDFEIFGNIDFDFSLDDSVQIINTPDLTVIHANDCWQPYTESYVKQLQQQIKKKAILASQVAIADCFPLNYNSYSSEEKTRLYDDRTLRHVNSVYENAIKLSVKYVLHYAGHIKVFNGNDNILNLTGFVERHLLKTVFLEGCGVELLDALPGEKIIDSSHTVPLCMSLI